MWEGGPQEAFPATATEEIEEEAKREANAAVEEKWVGPVVHLERSIKRRWVGGEKDTQR